MFTGLVETIGRIERKTATGAGVRLKIDIGPASVDARAGDSIAVNGVCLTISTLAGTVADFDAVRETIEKTTLRGATAGTRVNIERAIAAGGRFGGHFVQGHIDAVAELIDRTNDALNVRLRFRAEPDVLRQIVPKGSIAINGVSLTIATATATDFSVALIPETLQRTTLNDLAPGARVNIELDILGKYARAAVERILLRAADAGSPAGPNADRDWLRRLGWDA